MLQNSPIQLLTQQKLLLQMEYASEKEAYEKTTLQMRLERRISRGDAWWQLSTGKSYYNSLNKPCIEIIRTTDDDTEHNFEFNRPVVFFTKNDDGIRFIDIKGVVCYSEQDRMVVELQDMKYASVLQSTDPLGVQIFFDERSYQLMFEALDKVIKAKGNRLAYLRDLFYSHDKSERFSFADLRFPWLNATQEKAVNDVLRAKDVMVVHGPPGTGKTTTLVEAIHETLQRESQVLVCAQSNMAVDWISERLVDRGINVLRIGNPTRVNDKMLSFTYERRFEAHPDYPQLWSIRKALREIRANRKRRDDSIHQKIERLKSRATELEIRINQELFGEARVIASTLTGSAHRLLQGMKFTTLFVDEAAQALEAACWIPMRKVSRVVLAGDHCQLPPTVKNHAALRAGLGKTLMERIVENRPDDVCLLKIQYRMNEKIMQFSSKWFYDGKVESDPSVKFRGILDYDEPMLWIETNGDDCHEVFIGESFGRINKTEADLTLRHMEDYFKKIGKARVLDENIDVGIISPYRAQVKYLRQRIKKSQVFKPFRHLISVNTVDGFQGQERDIIFISLVRANEDGQIGFLADLRRMNVAITRARMKLIILGDTNTLCKHKFYKQLYEETYHFSPSLGNKHLNDGTESP